MTELQAFGIIALAPGPPMPSPMREVGGQPVPSPSPDHGWPVVVVKEGGKAQAECGESNERLAPHHLDFTSLFIEKPSRTPSTVEVMEKGVNAQVECNKSRQLLAPHRLDFKQ